MARSLFVVKDIKKGVKFYHRNIKSIRPDDELSPRFYSEILNLTATKDISRGTPLNKSHIDNFD